MIDHSSLDCIVHELVLSILIRHCPLTDWYLQLRLCIVRYKIDELIESFRNDGDGNDNGKKQQVYIGDLKQQRFWATDVNRKWQWKFDSVKAYKKEESLTSGSRPSLKNVVA